MKKLTTLFAIICTIALGSCTSSDFEEITPNSPATQTRPELTAGFDAEGTKTYVDANKNLHWHTADQISAFVGNTNNLLYQFKGETGDVSGRFSYVSGSDAQVSSLGQIYAVYPYNLNTTISENGVISLILPASQNYAEKSFGQVANTMIAITESIEDTFLPFKNICGYLKLNLYNTQDTKLRKLELKGNAGEKIAGAAIVTMTDGTPSLVMADEATTTVTLDCGEEGIALGSTSETATELWLVLPETTFSNGITITATATNGNVFGKSTNKEVAITHNKVQPMATLEAIFEEPKPANNEIWYTATAKVEPKDKTVFGATYISSEWDKTTGKGVITFDGNITTVGKNAFYQKSALTSITLPESVTSIGNTAFYNCGYLTSVIFPQNLISIGSEAFFQCTNLTKVDLPQSLTSIDYNAFSTCQKLTDITIPEGVTSIASGLFYKCAKLKNITFSDKVTYIGSTAFYNCSSLTSIAIPSGVERIEKQTFYGCSSLENITIPESVTYVAGDAFSGCNALPITDNIRYADSFLVETIYKDLSSYNIKEGTRFIGDNAFKNCTSLTNIIIPDGVISIGANAFQGCSSLTSINIPEGVTSIPERFVDCCSSLTTITLPKSVTSIGDYAFSGCSALQTLYVESETAPKLKVDRDGDNFSLTTCLILVPENSVEQYKAATVWKNWKNYIYPYGNKTVVFTANSNPGYNTTNDFGGATISSMYWLDSRKVGVIIFNKDITTFGTLFKNKNITGVTLPKSVTSFGEFAFYGCQYLTSIDIPEGVETISNYAFSYCNTLGTIKLPSTLKSIGEQAFYTNCNSVRVYCNATTPPTLGTKAFNANKSISLFVPRTSFNNYVYYSSEWKTTYDANINPIL